MNLDERKAVAGIECVAAAFDVRLPSEVGALIVAALHWRDGDPRRNALVPGFAPLEYSFSTWQPAEFRVAAQLFAGRTPTQRRTKTVHLARRLTERHLRAAFAGLPLAAALRRFGAFFGLTAAPWGLTGVEAYVEAADGDPLTLWLPGPLRAVSRPVFTGLGVRARHRDAAGILRDHSRPRPHGATGMLPLRPGRGAG
jgi:hypothetical protein